MTDRNDDLLFHHRRSIEEAVRASQAEDERDWAIHRTLSKLHSIAADAMGETTVTEQDL